MPNPNQANTTTEFTAPTFIVVRTGKQQAAEAAAVAADPEGGAGTFDPGTPLRAAGDASNTIVAYWTRWMMKPDQRSLFASNMGGPMNFLSVGQNPNKQHDQWLFDAAPGQWSSDAVLAALGFDTLFVDV